MPPFLVKATRSDTVRDSWERKAKPVMTDVYNGQRDRISNVIERDATPETLEQFLIEAFRLEPPIVKQAVQALFDEMVLGVAQTEQDALDVILDWETANDALLRVSAERAAWFADAMTQTSLKQTQGIITDWLSAEGTLAELEERISKVWVGPRPDAAAITETTNLVAQSRHVAWTESGVVWGYNVRTMNDSLVRPSHTEAARNGPYPLSDTTHQPPIDGDVNCRCFTSPVIRNPDE